MAPTSRQRILDIVIATFLTFISTIFLMFGTGAWALKEDVSDHKADVARIMQMQQRTLDAVCDAAKNVPHACRTAP